MSFSTIFQSYRDEANTSWLILGISQYSGELMCLAFRTQHGAPKRGYNVIPPGHSAPSKTLSQDNIVALFKKHKNVNKAERQTCNITINICTKNVYIKY